MDFCSPRLAAPLTDEQKFEVEVERKLLNEWTLSKRKIYRANQELVRMNDFSVGFNYYQSLTVVKWLTCIFVAFCAALGYRFHFLSHSATVAYFPRLAQSHSSRAWASVAYFPRLAAVAYFPRLAAVAYFLRFAPAPYFLRFAPAPYFLR